MHTTQLALALIAASTCATAQLSFEPGILAAADKRTDSVAVGDFNEDGLPDAAVMEGTGFRRVRVLLGAGDGSFSELSSFAVAPFTPRIKVLDVDGDGHLDLGFRSGFFENYGFTVRLGLGDGSFGELVESPAPGPNVDHVAFGDFNGDGVLDMAAANAGTQPAPSFPADLDVLLGDGDGSFTLVLSKPLPLWTSNGVRGIEVGDLTGDDVLDLAVLLQDGQVFIYQGFGNGGFGAATALPVASSGNGLALADLDGDGWLDLLVADPLAGVVALRAGLPGGGFAATTTLDVDGDPRALTVGDLDGDTLPDLVVAQWTSDDLSLRRGLGDGSFGPAVTISGLNAPQSPVLADLDIDGRPDVVLVNRGKLQTEDELGDVVSVLNHTYPEGSPFVDLGFALPGAAGYPVLLADGSLLADEPYAFRIANGPAGGNAGLVLGLTPLLAPFKGGTYVPFPDIQITGLPLDGSGSLTLAGDWPALPGGYTFWTQVWFVDAGAPAGWSATSGLQVDVP